ncbi:xylosidase : arabinofuranosidase [Aspergillus steynii IBT 23096]|uniref:Xylosidase: arabinofuranosidase n=1 Tax=Aspergillus steynii IBT 23096 TaxID=1392250 RepID=A0A2I2GSC9_9EURO|nr:xylosidase : arabinofuranosidase [Aspergillus steynii IBT 23096]PLB55779.1 xylosidase : arabinofuranosidase [Aspergillus steynii IBT 23096]
MYILLALSLLAMAASSLSHPVKDAPYTNPILGGWHSDPSCIYVADHDTSFCVTSTFIAFPGLPIYASKDLQNWKHVSNVFNRPSQIPSLADTVGQQGGIYAPTLRYHGGKFYLVVSFLGPETIGLVFTSTNPFDDNSWSEPIQFPVLGIDPDLFWDDDGTLYVTSSDNGIRSYSLDLNTGTTGPVSTLWNGTGGVYPEGPHLYRKDGYYYLMIAEGGTELGHAETMARSKHRTGPWEPCPSNPLLSNKGTTQYFQTVGHADLFQDGAGNWWAAALSTRSGPDWANYPMGRETVLVPATWDEGEWPVLQPVRGRMRGPLPRADRGGLEGKGRGVFAGSPDRVDFRPGESLPAHFLYWRFPKDGMFSVSPRGHPNTLRVNPSFHNLTGGEDWKASDGISLVMRRQTDTLFTYGVDVEFAPKVDDEEAGVTLFLTQDQHVDLGIVLLRTEGKTSLSFRFRATGKGNFKGTLETEVVPVPREWKHESIRLEIQAVSDTKYTFSAAAGEKRKVIGSVDSLVVSGDTGRFTGTLVGAYATSNGGKGTTPAYFSKWRYQGQGQKIDHDVIVRAD